MEDMPWELTCLIFQKLDPDSQKALRSTSTYIRDVTMDTFLRNFFVVRRHFWTIDSLEALRRITEHSNLTKYLKDLVLVFADTKTRSDPDLRRVWDEYRDDWDDWDGDEDHHEDDDDREKHIISKMCKTTLDYENKRVRRDGRGSSLLSQILQNLSRLGKIPSLTITSKMDPLPYGMRKFFVKDYGLPIPLYLPDDDRALQPVLAAIQEANFPLTNFGVHDIDTADQLHVQAFDEEIWRLPFWRNLRRFSIRFGDHFDEKPEQDITPFLNVVRVFTSLEDFSFGFPESWGPADETTAFERVTDALPSKQIRRLRVSGMCVESSIMIGFLASHRSTMEYLGIDTVAASSEEDWQTLLRYLNDCGLERTDITDVRLYYGDNSFNHLPTKFGT